MAEKDYVALNREGWTRSNAEYTDRAAHGAWAQDEITWGSGRRPSARSGSFLTSPARTWSSSAAGRRTSAPGSKRAGAARVVGVDVTPAQLETARRMDEEFGLGLELIEANAEDVPLPDESFDLAFSEYGASIWCDPALWIAEAARLLRPGGELVFLRGSTLRILCAPDHGKTEDRLQRPQKGMYRLDWEADEEDWEGVEFHPPTGELFQILRTNGFELIDFRELYAPDDAVDHEFYDDPPAEWAKQWPAEEIWRLRLQRR